MEEKNQKLLLEWLQAVLRIQCKDGILVLADGTEAQVRFRDNRVSAHACDDEETEVAAVRLVCED